MFSRTALTNCSYVVKAQCCPCAIENVSRSSYIMLINILFEIFLFEMKLDYQYNT